MKNKTAVSLTFAGLILSGSAFAQVSCFPQATSQPLIPPGTRGSPLSPVFFTRPGIPCILQVGASSVVEADGVPSEFNNAYGWVTPRPAPGQRHTRYLRIAPSNELLAGNVAMGFELYRQNLLFKGPAAGSNAGELKVYLTRSETDFSPEVWVWIVQPDGLVRVLTARMDFGNADACRYGWLQYSVCVEVSTEHDQVTVSLTDAGGVKVMQSPAYTESALLGNITDQIGLPQDKVTVLHTISYDSQR